MSSGLVCADFSIVELFLTIELHRFLVHLSTDFQNSKMSDTLMHQSRSLLVSRFHRGPVLNVKTFQNLNVVASVVAVFFSADLAKFLPCLTIVSPDFRTC